MNQSESRQQDDVESRSESSTDSTCDLNARLLRRIDVAPDAAIFHIVPNDKSLPSFTPGQFATLGLPYGEPTDSGCDDTGSGSKNVSSRDPRDGHEHEGLIKRAYSIASAPSNREYLEFYIVKVEQGQFTTRLWYLHDGDSIWLEPKIHGHFTLDHVPPSSDVFMIATGTGIAPYMSMLREFRSREHWRRVGLIHGVRFVVDLAYCDELQLLASQHESFNYVPTVTREPADSNWDGLRGRIQSLIKDSPLLEQFTGIKLSPKSCHVLLCGNPAMIEDAQQRLELLGFTSSTRGKDGNIHFEKYW